METNEEKLQQLAKEYDETAQRTEKLLREIWNSPGRTGSPEQVEELETLVQKSQDLHSVIETANDLVDEELQINPHDLVELDEMNGRLAGILDELKEARSRGKFQDLEIER